MYADERTGLGAETNGKQVSCHCGTYFHLFIGVNFVRSQGQVVPHKLHAADIYLCRNRGTREPSFRCKDDKLGGYLPPLIGPICTCRSFLNPSPDP